MPCLAKPCLGPCHAMPSYSGNLRPGKCPRRPEPVRLGRRTLWDKLALDRAVEALAADQLASQGRHRWTRSPDPIVEHGCPLALDNRAPPALSADAPRRHRAADPRPVHGWQRLRSRRSMTASRGCRGPLRGKEPLMADAALRFTDMNTQPAAELAERRLRDRGGRSASAHPRRTGTPGPAGSTAAPTRSSSFTPFRAIRLSFPVRSTAPEGDRRSGLSMAGGRRPPVIGRPRPLPPHEPDSSIPPAPGSAATWRSSPRAGRAGPHRKTGTSRGGATVGAPCRSHPRRR